MAVFCHLVGSDDKRPACDPDATGEVTADPVAVNCPACAPAALAATALLKMERGEGKMHRWVDLKRSKGLLS